MPRLTIEQRVWICSEYAKVNNAEEVLRRWRNSGIRTVRRTFQKFVREGTCYNINHGRSGPRRRTARTTENRLNEFDSHFYTMKEDLPEEMV